MEIGLQVFCFNAFSENTYIVWNIQTKDAWIIDPGCYEKHEEQILKNFVETNNLKINAILNTHCHIDHILGNWFCKQTFKVSLLVPKLEAAGIQTAVAYAPAYGFAAYQPWEPDGFLGDSLDLGGVPVRILQLPGHSVGHVGFYFENQNMIVSGDVLFRESIGRTDLPGGNHNQLIANIKTKLLVLNPECVVWPGHGSKTNIGHEKKYNPYLIC